MGQPLDPKKAFFYGQFVQAAYTMFRNPNPDPLRPEPAGIPPGWELGAWIHMSDFLLNRSMPEFYGIVAHSVADTDSRVIAIRGTEGIVEWIDDAAAIPTPFRQVPGAGRVAGGFDRIYSSLKVVKRPLRGLKAAAAAPETFEGSFADQLEKEVLSREAERGLAAPEKRERRQRPTVVTGHSLGGALTTLFVMENASKKKFDITTSCTFASPRVGNKEFARLFDQLPIDSWRIVNTPAPGAEAAAAHSGAARLRSRRHGVLVFICELRQEQSGVLARDGNVSALAGCEFRCAGGVQAVGVGCPYTPQLLHFSVTGPAIGCFNSAPVRLASRCAAFNWKYHFAGRSASSMSIK